MIEKLVCPIQHTKVSVLLLLQGITVHGICISIHDGIGSRDLFNPASLRAHPFTSLSDLVIERTMFEAPFRLA